MEDRKGKAVRVPALAGHEAVRQGRAEYVEGNVAKRGFVLIRWKEKGGED